MNIDEIVSLDVWSNHMHSLRDMVGTGAQFTNFFIEDPVGKVLLEQIAVRRLQAAENLALNVTSMTPAEREAMAVEFAACNMLIDIIKQVIASGDNAAANEQQIEANTHAY